MNSYTEFENIIFEYFFSKYSNKYLKKNECKCFKNIQDIIIWSSEFNSHFENIRDLKNSCTATEQQLKQLQVLDYYSGNSAHGINNYLRNRDAFFWNKEFLNQAVTNLDAEIQKFKTKDNIIVLRRMPSIYTDKNYKKGNIITEKGFLSTSLNLFQRLNYERGDKQRLKNESLLLINIPKNHNGIFIEKVQPTERQREEYEFLLPRNTKLKIISNKKILSNRILILEVIK